MKEIRKYTLIKSNPKSPNYDYDCQVSSYLFVHVSVSDGLQKASESTGDLTGPQFMRHVFIVMEVKGGRKRKRQGGDGTQADAIMPSSLCHLSPWRPRAPCAVCARSLRRSCLCF